MKATWLKNLLTVVVLGAAVVFVVEMRKQKGGCGPCAGVDCSLPETGQCAVPSAVPEEQKPQSLPLLLDLGADKCIPCKMMMPILEELETGLAGQLEVQFIDVWKNRDAGDQYGIRAIPTQIFFDADGKELFRHEGFFAREEILAKWAELGFDFKGQE